MTNIDTQAFNEAFLEWADAVVGEERERRSNLRFFELSLTEMSAILNRAQEIKREMLLKQHQILEPMN